MNCWQLWWGASCIAGHWSHMEDHSYLIQVPLPHVRLCIIAHLLFLAVIRTKTRALVLNSGKPTLVASIPHVFFPACIHHCDMHIQSYRYPFVCFCKLFVAAEKCCCFCGKDAVLLRASLQYFPCTRLTQSNVLSGMRKGALFTEEAISPSSPYLVPKAQSLLILSWIRNAEGEGLLLPTLTRCLVIPRKQIFWRQRWGRERRLMVSKFPPISLSLIFKASVWIWQTWGNAAFFQ